MKTFLHYLKLSHYPISHLCLLSLLLDSETTSRCDCWEGWRGNRCDICGGKVMVEMNYKILANFLAHFGLFLDFWILCPLHYMRIFFSPWPSIFFIFLWDSMVFVHFQKTPWTHSSGILWCKHLHYPFTPSYWKRLLSWTYSYQG